LGLVEEQVGLGEKEREQTNDEEGAEDQEQPGPIILVAPNGLAPGTQ